MSLQLNVGGKNVVNHLSSKGEEGETTGSQSQNGCLLMLKQSTVK